MGFFDFFSRKDNSLPEKRASINPANPGDAALKKWFGTENSGTGVYVDDELAFSVPTFNDCVRVITEDVGKTPLYLFRKNGRLRQKAEDHPIYKLINRRPNKWQTPFEFKQLLSRGRLVKGNGYAEIIFNRKTGEPEELLPLHPDHVKAFKAPSGKRAYAYQPYNGPRRIILQDEMLHYMGASDDGISGLSILDQAARTLGLAYSTMDYGAKFFANGARPGGVIEHPNTIGDEAYTNLKQSLNNEFQGTKNAHKTIILEEGMKYHAIQMSAEDAQFIESRKLSPIEICQFFRMPPHKVGLLDKATFSNIEQQDLEYHGDTLLSHLISFEETANRDLLKTEAERESLYFKFDPDILLRADIKSRYESYNIAVQGGWMSRNEVREKEDMNPFEGGDEYLQPLNMAPAGKDKPEPKKPDPKEE